MFDSLESNDQEIAGLLAAVHRQQIVGDTIVLNIKLSTFQLYLAMLQENGNMEEYRKRVYDIIIGKPTLDILTASERLQQCYSALPGILKQVEEKNERIKTAQENQVPNDAADFAWCSDGKVKIGGAVLSSNEEAVCYTKTEQKEIPNDRRLADTALVLNEDSDIFSYRTANCLQSLQKSIASLQKDIEDLNLKHLSKDTIKDFLEDVQILRESFNTVDTIIVNFIARVFNSEE